MMHGTQILIEAQIYAAEKQNSNLNNDLENFAFAVIRESGNDS